MGPIRFAAIDEHRRKATEPDAVVAWMIVTATLGPDGKMRYVEIPTGRHDGDWAHGAFAYDMENALYSLQYLYDNPQLDALD